VRTLSRHLLSRHLLIFTSALWVFFAIGTAAQILGHLGQIVEQQGAAGGALQTLLLRVATRYAGDAVPAACFAASFLCLGLAARAGELIGLRSCGVDPRRVAGQLLLAAGAISVASFAINETWLLKARGTLARYDAGAATAGTGPLWYHSGDTLYNAERRGVRGALHGVAIFDLDERGRIVAATHAAEARPEPGRWRLAGGFRTQLDPEQPTWSAADTALTQRPDAGSSLVRAQGRARPAPLALSQLIEAARAAGPGARQRRLELHTRLARPASVLAFALLAMPLALRVRPGGSLATPALVGAALLAGFHAVDAASVLAAQRGGLPSGLAPWLAPSLLAAGAALAVPRARR